ncbi:hypothetical protein PILCRDRAFT_830073 [Piloderma croceum F 1598]|uniref:TFIIS N-terminal domain-containing protein n=1 Tax=Piloderma croceum (strain F 1598) TaxID=765440 RepID=A0A0C3B3Q0_PILCF|nr:hypothetical protein PILCRDRAFT_830073 [Piloderma croceum F 1598]
MDSISIPRDIALGLLSDPERYLPVAELSPKPLAQPHDDVSQAQLRTHTPTLGLESTSSSSKNPSKQSTSLVTKKKKAKHNDTLEGDEEAIRVRTWRHKLQKAFLSKGMPMPDDMHELNTLLTCIEQYDNMTIQYLLSSRILKVMRHITLLDEEKMPRNAEYNFLGRAQVLVDKWRNIMHPDQPKDAVEEKTENGDGTAVDMTAVEVGVGGSWVVVNGDALFE